MYGKLYNWYVVSDPRGLAPKGWHIPSEEEWNTLTASLGGEATAGLSMKSDSGWQENKNGNNQSRFMGLPGGSVLSNGMSGGRNTQWASWWSSTDGSNGKAPYRHLYFDHDMLLRAMDKVGSGNAVRCIKDLPD